VKLRTRLAIVLAALATATGLVVAILSYTTTTHQLLASVDLSLRETAVTLRAHPALLRRRASFAPTPPILLDGPAHDHGGLLPGVIVEVIKPDGVTTLVTGAQKLSASYHDVAIARGLATRWLRTQHVGSTTYRVLTISLGRRGALVVARNINDVLTSLGVLRIRFGLLVVGAALAAALLGLAIATAISRPILRLANTITTLTPDTDSSLHSQAQRSDEVGVLARAFERALGAVRDSEAQQRRLIQNASHELRTPLTSLRTNIDLLGRYDALGANDRARILADLDTETRELTNLVSELVDLVLTEQPNEVTTALDVGATVTELIDRFRARSNRELAYTSPPMPVVIQASKRAIDQVVSNLLDNAIKFSPPGSTITIRLTPTNLEVTNLADPISDVDRDRIFERFYRTPASRAIDGSGLGLAIVREVITKIGGTTYVYNTDTALGNAVTIGVTFSTQR